MYEFLLPTLTFVAVVSLGGAVLVARNAARQSVRSRLDALGDPSLTGAELPLGAMRGLGVLGRIGAWVSSGRSSPKLATTLANAGYHGSSVPMIYLGAKIVLLLVGSVGLAIILLPVEQLSMSARILCIVWGSGVLFFVPNLFVRYQRERRRTEIRQHLPDALDLLEICVSAGMGLDMAWNSVASEIRDVSPTLADEMVLTDLEIHLGAPRSTAMRNMAERTSAEEVTSLVSMLVQSDRFGTSVADALRTFAASMREARSQRAQEAAEKTPVKLLFPLILFIFPAVVIVMVGPAIIQWTEVIRH
jgi:tight adherence protein C